MNKFFILFFIAVSLIGVASVSALTSYPGETQVIALSNVITDYNYTIEGNNSAIGIEIVGSNAYVDIPEDYAPGEFTITFTGLTSESQPVVQTVTLGGGSYRPVIRAQNITNNTIIAINETEAEPEPDKDKIIPIWEWKRESPPWKTIFTMAAMVAAIIIVLILVIYYGSNQKPKTDYQNNAGNESQS